MQRKVSGCDSGMESSLSRLQRISRQRTPWHENLPFYSLIHFSALLLQVILHRGYDADGLHQAIVSRRVVVAFFAGGAALICGKNREHALIRLPDRPHFATGIGSEALRSRACV